MIAQSSPVPVDKMRLNKACGLHRFFCRSLSILAHDEYKVAAFPLWRMILSTTYSSVSAFSDRLAASVGVAIYMFVSIASCGFSWWRISFGGDGACVARSTDTVFGIPCSSKKTVLARTSKIWCGPVVRQLLPAPIMSSQVGMGAVLVIITVRCGDLNQTVLIHIFNCTVHKPRSTTASGLSCFNWHTHYNHRQWLTCHLIYRNLSQKLHSQWSVLSVWRHDALIWAICLPFNTNFTYLRLQLVYLLSKRLRLYQLQHLVTFLVPANNPFFLRITHPLTTSLGVTSIYTLMHILTCIPMFIGEFCTILSNNSIPIISKTNIRVYLNDTVNSRIPVLLIALKMLVTLTVLTFVLMHNGTLSSTNLITTATIFITATVFIAAFTTVAITALTKSSSILYLSWQSLLSSYFIFILTQPLSAGSLSVNIVVVLLSYYVLSDVFWLS